MPVWVALLTALILGTILGLINGTIVTRIRTFPLIVTLATAVIFQGTLVDGLPGPDVPGLSGVLPGADEGPVRSASPSTST